MINIIHNELLINHSNEYDVVLVGTNCYQVLRNGFQYEIARKFPHVKVMNNQTKYGDISRVGTILECKNHTEPLITLLYISFGYNFKGNDKEYIDYDGLRQCLKLCNILYKKKKVATTMLGCTFFDGNGSPEKVMEIMNETIKNFQLDVYDYEQINHREHKRQEFIELKNKRNKLDFNKEKENPLQNDKEDNINRRPS